MRILHVALPEDWARAAADGSYDVSTRGVTVAEADFVHAATAAQLPGVLGRFYADVPAVDLLALDVDRLEHEGASVVWETPPGVTDGPYPHVYGIIPVAAVVEVTRLNRSPGSGWDLSAVAGVGGP
jgi:uncharacterized protein (DUF952 family)